MLCFVDADWSLFARPFVQDAVHVAWQTAGIKLISQAGTVTYEQREQIAESLVVAFPRA